MFIAASAAKLGERIGNAGKIVRHHHRRYTPGGHGKGICTARHETARTEQHEERCCLGPHRQNHFQTKGNKRIAAIVLVVKLIINKYAKGFDLFRGAIGTCMMLAMVVEVGSSRQVVSFRSDGRTVK